MLKRQGFILILAFCALLLSALGFSQDRAPFEAKPPAKENIGEAGNPPVSSGRYNGAIAYMAAEDRSVYVIDLNEGRVLHKSAPIEQIGYPTAISLSAENDYLYIASEGWRKPRISKFAPVVALKIEDDFGFSLERSFLKDDEKKESDPAFTVVAARKGDLIFVGYLGNPESTTVIDGMSGEVLARYDIPILDNYTFSPDGKKAASIWSSGSRTVTDNNGQEVILELPGGVAEYRLRDGKRISKRELSDNRGLNAPWSDRSSPFYHIASGELLQVYNRQTGVLINTIDLHELTGLFLVGLYLKPMTINDYHTVVLPMSDQSGVGYALVIDAANSRVLRRIRVGNYPTNIAIARLEPD